MLFNSIEFICVFAPVVVAGYFLLSRFARPLACLWLCAASLFFYGWWNIAYVPLLLASAAFNYSAGYLIARSRDRRADGLLAAAITGDLALLGYYKYAHFFVQSADRLLHADWSIGTIILPLGISFFTFTQIAFLVDARRGKAKEFNFVHYLLFVTYFPHLIAGPILHHAQMMPQFALRQTYRLHWDNVATGLTLFIIGLFKKMVLADSLGALATLIFDAVAQGGSPTFTEAWYGALAYTLQLYFDFSGYTDMAIGISLVFNIRLPFNFNSPYKAVSIIDFWRRWHMTLSAFLRDYLYIPLGGNRHGPVRRYVNLMLTMLLGGLWHGAGWTFVLWGGVHGLYLVVNHAFRTFREKVGWPEQRFGWAGRAGSTLLTFLCVTVAWSIFRAADGPTMRRMLEGLCGMNGLSLPAKFPHAFVNWATAHGIAFQGFVPLTGDFLQPGWALPFPFLGLLIVWLLPNSQEWMRLPDPSVLSLEPVRAAEGHPLLTWRPQVALTSIVFGLLLALIVLYLASGPSSEFLYFQF